jgi:hypothetical protein
MKGSAIQEIVLHSVNSFAIQEIKGPHKPTDAGKMAYQLMQGYSRIRTEQRCKQRKMVGLKTRSTGFNTARVKIYFFL